MEKDYLKPHSSSADPVVSNVPWFTISYLPPAGDPSVPDSKDNIGKSAAEVKREEVLFTRPGCDHEKIYRGLACCRTVWSTLAGETAEV
jgi:hypothetical protein